MTALLLGVLLVTVFAFGRAYGRLELAVEVLAATLED